MNGKISSIDRVYEIMNLKFINNDIATKLQIKETERRLDLIEKINSLNYKELLLKIENLQKIAYISMGGILTLQIVLKFIVK